MSEEDLRMVVEGLRGVQIFCGPVGTISHKQSILELCDKLKPAA